MRPYLRACQKSFAHPFTVTAAKAATRISRSLSGCRLRVNEMSRRLFNNHSNRSFPFRPKPPAAAGLLVLLCLLLYLPGFFTVPPIDRDEARFAQASYQMLESQDYVRVSFQDEPRHKKPIGIYWLQVLSAKLFSGEASKEIWHFRIPSLLGAILAVLGTYAIGRKLFEDKAALLGAALLACTLLMAVEANMATTDAALLACIVASQWSLAHLYVKSQSPAQFSWTVFFVFWTAQGFGILIKGPLAPFVSLLTIVSLGIWDRKWQWLRGLRPLPGVLLLLVMVLPWTVAVWKATDGSFFRDAFSEDFFPKLVSGQESHGAPPGYYLLLLIVAFWPASLFLGFSCGHAWKERAVQGVKFCLCWIVPAWIVFEAVPTKLPHYVLPLYPALALLSARTLLELEKTPKQWPRFWPRFVPMGFMVLFAMLVTTGAFALPWLASGLPSLVGAGTALLGLAIAVQGIRYLKREKLLHTVLLCIGGNILVFGLIFQFIFPRVDFFWLSRTIQEEISQMAPSGNLERITVASSGYHEPSLVFLLGTHTRLVTPEGAAQMLLNSPETISIVWTRERSRFLERAEKLGIKPRHVGGVEGFNYSKGRVMKLEFYAGEKGEDKIMKD